MRFVTYRSAPDAQPKAGVLTGDQVTDLSGAGVHSVLEAAAGGAALLERVRQHVAGAPKVPLSSVTLLAPIPRPPKIICVGLNYRDHAIESNMEIPPVPTIFNKFPTSVIAPGVEVVLPKVSQKPDYEAELAVVIGTGGRNVPADKWEDHVFGYTILNDVSARDYQMRTTQWLMGKTFDTFCPMGPAIVTKDEVGDPHILDISLELNGEVMQNSNTRNLIFRIPELIADLSSVFTLEPGDIITTGTPAGVGFARKPPRFLQAGDEMVVKIQHLGELRNPVVAES